MHTLGSFVLALQVQDGATASSGAGEVVEILSPDRADQPRRLRNPRPVLDRLVGDHSSPRRFPTGRFSDNRRRSSTSFATARSSPKSRPSARRCPTVPLVGVFQAGYAELNAQFRLTSPPASPARRRSASNAQEPRRRRPCAHSGRDHRSEQARAAPDVPRDDRQRYAIHRPVRHGGGHHDHVQAHRPAGLDQSARSSGLASAKRSSRRRPGSSPPFRPSTSTTTSLTA